jgi:predicted amidohydrolase
MNKKEKPFKVAAIQLSPVLFDRDSTTEKAIKAIDKYGVYLAGPLPEGEDMAVAEIDLKSIVKRKSVLDTVGHYSRPDILKLLIDRSDRKVVEEMPPQFEDISERPSESGKQESTK